MMVPPPIQFLPIIYHVITGKIWQPWKDSMVLLAFGLLASEQILPNFFPSRSLFALCWFAALALGLPVSAFGALLWTASKSMSVQRQESFETSKNELEKLVSDGRARRRKGYYLYLPLQSETKINESRDVMGLILIPGALVDPVAYSVIASRLSDRGLVVAVVDTEPFRAPTVISGVGHCNIAEIMEDVLTTDYGEATTIKEWAIGGHSMGALCAHSLLTEMKPLITKLVLWGTIRSKAAARKPLKDDAETEVLVLVGSEDPFYSKEDWKRLRDELPKRPGATIFHEIDGGNHSGFVHYGPQTFPKRDGDRTITLDKQQSIAVRETVNFLFGNNMQT